MVEFMAGRATEEEIARLVLNPQTNAGISPVTLRKHFRDELDRGHTKANLLVAQGLYKNATTATPTYPGGIPLAQIFWLKTQARWRTVDKEPTAPLVPPTPEQMDARDTARRMAFLLSAGAAQVEREKEQEPAPKPKKVKAEG